MDVAWQLLLDTSQQPMMIIDAELRIVAANRFAQQMLSTNSVLDVSIVGQTLAAFWHDESLLESLRRAVTGEPVHESVFGLTAPLSMIHLHTTPLPGQFLAISAMVENLLTYSDVVESANDIVYTVLRDGTISSLSPAFERLTGWTSDEWRGKTLWQIFEANGSPHVQEFLAQVLNGESISNYSVQVWTKAGNTLILETWLSHLLKDRGTVVGIVGIARDVTLQRNLEAELRRSESELRAVFAAMTDLVFILDQDGRYLRMVDTHRSDLLYGPPDVFLGKLVTDVLPRETGEQMLGAVQRVLRTSQSESFEYSLSIHDSEQWFVATVSPLSANSVLAVIHDITHIKHTEHALHLSDERFRQLAESLDLGFFLFDAALGKIVYVNPGYERILGITLAERQPSAEVWLSKIHPEDRPRIEELTATRLGQQYEMIYRYEHPKGQWRWLRDVLMPVHDSQGRFVRTAGFIEDITEQRQTELALRERESQFLQLTENLSMGFFLYDFASDKVVYINSGYTRILGISFEEIQENSYAWLDHIHAEDRVLIDVEIQRRPRPHRELIYRYFPPNASDRQHWIRDASFPIYDAQGNLVQIAGFVEDITDQHTLELERQQAEKQMLELSFEREKANMLEMLINDTSHDLRTPLTVVKSSAYLLRKFVDRAMQIVRMLEAAKAGGLAELLDSLDQTLTHARDQLVSLDENGQRLQYLLESMLEMARLDGGVGFEFVPTNLNVLLAQAVEQYYPLAQERHITVRRQFDPNMPLLKLDPHEFRRVIQNLLENALNYTPENGRVDVSTYRQTESGEVVFAIRDTGIGIPAADLPHIFKRFYRADRARSARMGGSGLGLAIVEKILKAHKGRIEVESQLDYGSVFTVYLPLSASI